MIILFSKLRSKVLPLGTLFSHSSKEHLFFEHYQLLTFLLSLFSLAGEVEILARIKDVEPFAGVSWWQVPSHDYGLLLVSVFISLPPFSLPLCLLVEPYFLSKGVEKYGFGQWEDICEDSTLPFHEVASRMLAGKQETKSTTPAVQPYGKQDPSLMDVDAQETQPALQEAERGTKEEETMKAEQQEEKQEEKIAPKEGSKDNTDKIPAQKSKSGKSGPLSKALCFPRESLCKKRLDTILKLAERNTVAKPGKSNSPSSSPPRSTKHSHQSSITGYLREGTAFPTFRINIPLFASC